MDGIGRRGLAKHNGYKTMMESLVPQHSVTGSHFTMKRFSFLVVVVGLSFAAGDKESLDDDKIGTTTEDIILSIKQQTDPTRNNQNSHRPLEYFITPDLSLESRHPDDDSVRNFPHSQGFVPDKPNFKYGDYPRQKPPNFVLGLVSSDILNQRRTQEYIPYPPNGDPYNYPAYRGQPRTTEPPVVRAYERASKSNYIVQSANFDHQNPRRLLTRNNFQQGFPNEFRNFGLDFYRTHDYLSDAFTSPDRLTRGEEYRRSVK